MRRLVPARIVVPALLLVYPLAAVLTPDLVRQAGLDVWNVGRDEAQVREADATGADLDAQLRSARHRSALAHAIAERLGAGQVTRGEAEDAVLALGTDCPEWFALLRDRYVVWGNVPAGASDRAVAAAYLRIKLAWLRGEAERCGDATQATALTDRLARFEDEAADAVVSTE